MLAVSGTETEIDTGTVDTGTGGTVIVVGATAVEVVEVAEVEALEVLEALVALEFEFAFDAGDGERDEEDDDEELDDRDREDRVLLVPRDAAAAAVEVASPPRSRGDLERERRT